MKIGIIELPSGKWEWSTFQSGGGTTIIYRHWTRYEEEMRNWLPGKDLSGEMALGAAKEAILRIWVDGFGSRWQITLEPIRTALPGVDQDAAGRIHLVFTRGTQKVRVDVAREVRLGELTPFELTSLLVAGEAKSGERHPNPTRPEILTRSAA